MIRTVATALVALLVAVAAAPGAQALNPFEKSNFNLSESDIETIRATTQPFHDDETIALGTVYDWSNEETGNHGTAMLVDRFTHDRMPCLRIQHDITISDVADSFHYVIDSCQVADGSWKLL